ncbi:MAG: hypothetical protein J7521_15125 [Caulobacter sp.]|nr:hypothetical protein [Caulobacter sp.]
MHKIALLAAVGLFVAGEARAQQLLADANKDDKVTLAEYQDNRRKFLMRADHDKDGKISAAEWKRGADILREEIRETGTDGWSLIGKANIFEALDTNKDGFVTPAEIDAATAARFAKLDLNHDGVITRAEARQLDRMASAKPKS